MLYSSEDEDFPIIDLGDYILRKKTLDDTEDFFRYYSDPNVNKYIISDIPRDLEEARREISYWMNVHRRGDGIYFAIARKDNNQLIGSIGLSSLNHRHDRIEASYDLAQEYWNKGITSKALKEVIRYGFEELRVNRIEAFAMVDNQASRKVLENCGFVHEGELRQHRKHNGRYVDMGIFSILYQDYQTLEIYND
ncbi:MAG: GNAT family N-acetyltransferase [Proteobacteria bacterium]|nr:GNAT family N-acetyltransferase [Pseudomonadota bacterium]